MRVPRLALPLTLAAALAGCAQQTTHLADRGDCTDAARQALVARGLDPATITSTNYHVTRAIESGAVEDRNVWVRTSTCRGYLVARVDGGCNVIELYSMGNCALPERKG